MKEFLFDNRRLILVPGDLETTLDYCVSHWIDTALKAIEDHDFFAVALSGGSTPKAIYQKLVVSEAAQKIDWKKVFLFWSDERSVSPSSSESNYHMAMEEGGLNTLPVPRENIFRMVAEATIERNAQLYEQLILDKLGRNGFDLIMLGMGSDGHTASLFPHTQALQVTHHLVTVNEIPAQKTWRMTFTYECINTAKNICLYVLGASKAKTLEQVFFSSYQPEEYPSQKVGTPLHKALWILDEEASRPLEERLEKASSNPKK